MRVGGVEIDDGLVRLFQQGDHQGLLANLDLSQPAGLFLRGLAWGAMGRQREAEQDFVACSAALPLETELQRKLLRVLRHQELAETAEFLRSHCDEPDLHPQLRGCMWHVRGIAEGKLRQTSQSAASLLEAIRHFREANDPWSIAHVRDTLGTLEAARGRLEQAMQCYAMALVDKSLLQDRLGMALTLGNLGRVHLRAGRFPDAIECFERDMLICHELGDLRGQCRMHNDLGRTLMASGDWVRSQEELKAGMEQAEQHGFSDIAFYCHKDLALLHTQQRRFEMAESELEAAKRHLTEASAEYLQLLWKEAHGEFLAAKQDRRGIDILQDVVDRFHKLDLPDSEIPARIALARALADSKQVFSAERALLAGMRLAQSNGYVRYLATLNEALTQLDLTIGLDFEEHKQWIPPDRTSVPTAQEGVGGTGAYLIRAELGSGGFGTVYRAYDSNRGMEVALKVVSMASAYDGKLRAALVESTKTELSAASRVRHPGIVRVYAVGNNPDGDLYICQEFIDGESLRQRMNHAEMTSLASELPTLLGITYALEALHEAHVFHRDLKPQNILLRNHDQPVLIDFGIAQLRPPSWFDKPDIAGTLEYMAPEQALGKSVDARADLYSFGVILYEWLTGRRPLRLTDTSWAARVAELQKQAPKPITIYRPDIPPRLATLVHQLLDKRPRRRPSSARLVAESLQMI
jgi:tetratricopeptide (TPR) repeat protein/predicted Ser/Thr protein kinase